MTTTRMAGFKSQKAHRWLDAHQPFWLKMNKNLTLYVDRGGYAVDLFNHKNYGHARKLLQHTEVRHDRR